MTLTQIFAKVLNMSLTASLVIVLVIAARFVLRKSPKVFSYALWAVVLFRLLCPVSLPSPVSLLGLMDAPVAQTEGVTTTVEYIPYKVVEAAAENPQPDNKPQNTVAQAPTQSQQIKVEPQKEPLSAAEIITYIWLAGIAVMVIVGVGSYLRFRKHLTGAMQVKDNIYLVDHIDSAFVAGLIRPKVYLPSDIPLKQMGYIIAHEQYHIRRLDHVTKHLSFAALCIHWFNPFVWVAFILSGKDLEMSCDEAVINRLGEDIRADYSASLLSLATGRRIIAGTPLAFGEGDTKGRINNMAKWKQPKKWVSIVSFILCFTILTACAANPTQNIVTSKNDGALDEALQNTQSANDSETSRVQITTDFTSTDGSVQFHINIDEEIYGAAMPVIEVVPSTITSEDIERVAKALLGDVDFYDNGPGDRQVYSKSQYQEMIARMSPYANVGAMTDLMGSNSPDDHLRNLLANIARITEAMETAPEENPFTPCDWTLKPDSYYNESGASGDKWLVANAKIDDMYGKYMVIVRDQGDYKLNRFIFQLGAVSLDTFLDRQIYWANLCRTAEPTQEQIEAAQDKVMDMLKKMDLGDWHIAETEVNVFETGGEPEYMLQIKAVPELHGIPAIYGQRNIPQSDDYAGAYALTQATFLMSSNGNLIDMHLDSPVEIKSVVNENVATLSVEQLTERMAQQLSLSDVEAFTMSTWGITAERLAEEADERGEALVVHVDITQMEYGFGRVMVKDTTDSYYYVPVMLLRGTVNIIGAESGEGYLSGYEKPLLCINAVDGSIITN